MKIKLIGGPCDGQTMEIQGHLTGHIMAVDQKAFGKRFHEEVVSFNKSFPVEQHMYSIERITTLDGHLLVFFYHKMTLLDALEFLIKQHHSPGGAQ